MNKYTLIVVSILSVIITFTSCGKGNLEDIEENTIVSPFIEGLTLNNYPKVDGSTSAAPLNVIIACRVLGIGYKWVGGGIDGRGVEPVLGKKNSEIFWRRIKSSQTHQSFINLIDKETDLILSARKMSPDEKDHADTAGVSLIETPIALDAFIFIVHPDNPVESLTIKQIQDIYTGKIIYWNEVGGNNEEMKPFVRNANSGSQEWMEMYVLKDLDVIELPENSFELIFSMAGALDMVSHLSDSICYTFYYYKEWIANDKHPKTIAIEGIYPNRETISDKSYPYVAEVYAVIRQDLDKSSMAYKLYEWIQTESGKQAIFDSGYIPYH